MVRRLKQLTCTMSIDGNTVREPYIAYTIEMDTEDEQKALIEKAGTRSWTAIPKIKEGFKELVDEIVGDMKAEVFSFEAESDTEETLEEEER